MTYGRVMAEGACRFAVGSGLSWGDAACPGVAGEVCGERGNAVVGQFDVAVEETEVLAFGQVGSELVSKSETAVDVAVDDAAVCCGERIEASGVARLSAVVDDDDFIVG